MRLSKKISKTQLKNLKVERRQWKLSKKWRKSQEVTNASSYGSHQGKIFETFKANNKFINLINFINL